MTNHIPGHLCLARKAVEFIREQFRGWPPKALAKFLGVPAETLKNWFNGTSKPPTDWLSHLFAKLGPGFISYCMAPFEETHLDMKAARIEAQIKKLEAELEAARKIRPMVRAVEGKQARALGGMVAFARNSNDEVTK